MNHVFRDTITGLRLGTQQTHRHVSVVPLLEVKQGSVDYLTMREALKMDFISIEERSPEGTVPEILVLNKGDRPVLIINGEEVSGAKQNRVLNVTVLLKERTTTKLPVSCTESGRWSYSSKRFEESGNVMSTKIRHTLDITVTDSLRMRGDYTSNQGAIWTRIHEETTNHGVRSNTNAMSDTHDARQKELDDYLEHFPCLFGQLGFVACINGEVIGLDLVSKQTAFEGLHPKLIKSYVLDALIEEPRPHEGTLEQQVIAFLEQVLLTKEEQYDSVGYGTNLRYSGQDIIGSVLVHEDTVVHASFTRGGHTSLEPPALTMIPEEEPLFIPEIDLEESWEDKDE